MREPRRLSTYFIEQFQSGILAPLLAEVHHDRDLILEIRQNKVDIYCKGQVATHIEPRDGGFALSADKAFWAERSAYITSADQMTAFVNDVLPRIKHRIACHKKGSGAAARGGLEVEFEQLIIRANNLEPSLNTEYFVIDRQGIAGEGLDRTDILAVYWPRNERAQSKCVYPAIVEVKFGLNGGLEGLADQLVRYHAVFAGRMNEIADESEGILRQKIELGLYTGASPDALKKLKALPISRKMADLRFVVTLVDYNPHSRRLDLQGVQGLPFANQISFFRLGFGLWEANQWGDWRA